MLIGLFLFQIGFLICHTKLVALVCITQIPIKSLVAILHIYLMLFRQFQSLYLFLTLHVYNLSGIHPHINKQLQGLHHDFFHSCIKNTDITFSICFIQIMLGTIILRTTGIRMSQLMSTVTTYHFTGQAMCLILPLCTSVGISPCSMWSLENLEKSFTITQLI